MSYSKRNTNPLHRAAATAILAGLLGVVMVLAPKARAQVRVTAIATALNHISVIELAPGETVERVATGATPSQMEVQWTGPFVLIKPLQTGLSTNLVVFSTKGAVYSYEVLPAGNPDTMTMLVRQYDQTTLTKDQALAAALARERESTGTRNTQLLLHTHVIDTKAVDGQKAGIAVRVTMASSDALSDYVRFTLVNHDSHSYRVLAPTVVQIKPVSAAGFALANVNTQLAPARFAALTGAIERRITLTTSTLQKVELLPGSTLTFTIAFPKPKATPGIFEFNFAKDYGNDVVAYAVF